MPRVKANSTKTSVTLSVIFHTVIVLLIVLFAAREGMLGRRLKKIAVVIVPKEKKPDPPKAPPTPPATPPKEEVEPKKPDQPPPVANTAPPPMMRPGAVNAPPAAAPPAFVFTDGAKTMQPSTGGTVVRAIPGVPPVTAKAPPPVTTRPTSTPGTATFGSSTNSGSVAKLLETRQKAAAVTDAIGAEQISRSVGNDAGDLVTKMTATTVVDGKFTVIRGLSDRYNNTTLNGGELPSADPYRKAAQVDMFNASQIEKIVTTKTFTPDQRGDFTGGAVNIVTKSFPDRALYSFSAGMSYNTQATLNERFLSYHGGATDAFGMDDGARALPSALRSPGALTPATSAALLREFKSTQFAPTSGGSPLNQGFAASLGNTISVFGKPFGYFAGVNYSRNYSFYENGINARYDSRLNPRTAFTDSRAIEDVNWGSVVNLALQVDPEHELNFNFLYNQSSEDMARQQQGSDYTTGNDPSTITHINTLHFTERHLHTFQFRGKHRFIELLDARLDWLASFSNTTQDEPDLRYFNYYSAPDGLGGTAYYFDNSLPAPNRPTRYFRQLEEDNRNLKLDLTLPFRQWHWQESEFKIGVFQSKSERTFGERTFTIDGSAGFDTAGDPNNYLNPAFPRTLSSPFGNQNYRGSLAVQAAYAMLDVPLLDKVRFIAGVRLETTDLKIINNGLPSKPLKANDKLPAVGLVWSVTTNMNLRLNYGSTLARPTFREIASYESYDPMGDEIFVGNPDLQRTLIDNFDVRWEWFPRPGEVLSIGAFYKDLQGPIEKYLRTLDGGKISFVNRSEAKVYGVEFEARKSLDFLEPNLANFTFGGNFSLIQSEVPLTDIELFNKRSADPSTSATRPLYDQSPYVLNLDLSYDNRRLGTSATLQYNAAGERIYIALGKGPDIYEQPPGTLDFVLTQKLSRHLKMKLTARNLSDPVFKRTYGADKSGPIYSAHHKGRTFGLSLSLDF